MHEIGLERGGGIAWYLFATLYCYLIFYLVINKFRVYKVSYFFIPILLTINIIFSSVHYYIFPVGGIKFDRIFMRNWLFEGLPFMLIGHFIARYKSRLIKKQNIFYIFGIFISLLLTCIEKYVLSLIVVSYDGAELYFFNIILVIFCILFAVKNEQSSIIPQITYVGNKLSLFIYVMHQLILYIMSFIAFHIEPPIADNLIYLWMKPFVALILVIVIGLIFNNFLFKIKNKIKSNLKY